MRPIRSELGRKLAAVAVSALGGLAVLGCENAIARDDLRPPREAVGQGRYSGAEYVEYHGILRGQTSTGTYRVPYQITAPADPARANRTVLVETIHPVAGLAVLDRYLLRELVFGRGFTHAAVGYSTARYGEDGNLGILDPEVPGTYVHGGLHRAHGQTDTEILVDFAHALVHDRDARELLGPVKRRYLSGLSASSKTVLDLIASGKARHAFELVFALVASSPSDPQRALADGRFDGRMMIINSKWDDSSGLLDRGQTPVRYRFQVVPGPPHLIDTLVPFISSETTPATWQPLARASFIEADRWVRTGKPPPPSTHLKLAGGEPALDPNGNMIAIDSHGRRVPRLPFVELGEATFKSGFLGRYLHVRTLAELGFASSQEYRAEFDRLLTRYRAVGYILGEDAAAMSKRAGLCPGLTYTETYRDHYAEFVNAGGCRP